MQTFTQQTYFEANYDAFDELIQQELGIPGFQAQRVYEWQNDSYQVEVVTGINDEKEQEDLKAFLWYLDETRELTISNVRANYPEEEPEHFCVLDWQIEEFKVLNTFPSFVVLLNELASRKVIPEGQYLISISW